MCGIAGVFSRNDPRPPAQARLAAMVQTIRHRGPDGDGFHTEPHVGLGFCRLAIIDLAGGDQPLCNEDGSVWLSFNGEIYNYRELAEQLRARGHVFKTKSDSETIVHAYEEWGEACVEKLRGIFAFAIWDRKQQRLMLARDHSGVKPLFFTESGDEIVFASEAKALLADQPSKRHLDLLGYWTSTSKGATTERSMFKGVCGLAAGTVMLADAAGTRFRRYWNYAPTADLEGAYSDDYWVQSLREHIERSVREQVMSDVPLGAYLSGGVDSAAVVACVARMGGSAFRTFTTVNAGVGEDEKYARICADALKLPQQQYFRYDQRSDAAALIPLMAWMCEGEFDAGYLARYQLARFAASNGVKVILTGQGIDEILCGYWPSFDALLGARLSKQVQDAAGGSYRGLPPLQLDSLAREIATEEEMALLGTTELRDEHAGLSRGLLRLEDTMGMAASVEVRVPLLDHQLLELCAQIPHRQRRTLLAGKAVLRQAVAPWLPKEVAERPKFAFNATLLPLTRMAEASGPAGAELRHLLTDEVIKKKGYFTVDVVREAKSGLAYPRLDLVLIVHLLDELFVTNFDAARFATPPPLDRVVPNERRASTRKPEPLAAHRIPRLHHSVAMISSQYVHDVENATLVKRKLRVDFVESKHEPLFLSDDAMEILSRVDGVRTYQDICVELEDTVTLNDLLAFCEQLVSRGLLSG